VHGESVVNECVGRSELMHARFAMDVLPMQFAESIGDMGRPSVRKAAKALLMGVALATKLVAKRPSAVYLTLAPTGGAFYRDCLFIAIMKALRVQRIYHLHGKGIASHLGVDWKRRLYTWAFSGAHVIHLSPLLGSDVEELVPPDNIAFVGNGVRQSVVDVPSRRDRVGPPRILYLSNMTQSKGALVLLRALVTLRERGLAFEATFAGADRNDGSVEELTNVVRAHGLADHVRYVGPAYGDAKDALFRDSDIFVFPTFYRREAFPLVLLEAMQWGLPVISTPEGAIAEIVKEGETGFLVPQRDPESLADRIAVLLQDPRRRVDMGQQGRKRYLARYTLHEFEQNLAAAITRSLAPR
jgi:glycosyltransferase involved in cell wall biosynthesis